MKEREGKEEEKGRRNEQSNCGGKKGRSYKVGEGTGRIRGGERQAVSESAKQTEGEADGYE